MIKLNDAGLPEPGRELDEWLWVNVLGNESVVWEPHIDVECPYCGQGMYRTDRRAWCGICREWRYSPYQEYSTAAAYHQVMEAVVNSKLDGCIYWQYDRLFVRLTTWGPVVGVPWLDTWEETLAWAVCCYAWKQKEEG